uniref:CS domain-containing protein n=1 Tax=Lotharella globosa TaxID=91324 RepID=A0A6U3ELU9_9EUKA
MSDLAKQYLGKKTFKYIFIPAAFGEPMREMEAPQPQTLQDNKFIESLRKHFTKVGGKMDKKIVESQLAEKMKGKKIDDSMMNELLRQSSVEIVPLSVPVKATKFLSISMYVDDQGIAKNLPKNERASKMALSAGRPTEVRGDAFLGRVFDDQDSWTRVDFTMADCSSDAEWINFARAVNKTGQGPSSMADLKAMMGDKVTMLNNSQPRGGAATAPKEPPSGSTDKYSWKQGGDEIEITISVPPECKSKHVKVKFQTSSIAVEVQGESILQGKLFGTIHTDGSTWSLSGDGKERALSIELEKAKEITWTALLQ